MTAIATRTETEPQPIVAEVVQFRPAPRECSHMKCHAVGEYAHPAGLGLRACLSHLLIVSAMRSAS